MKQMLLIAILFIACLTLNVFAQPGPGPQQGPGQGPGFGPGQGGGPGQGPGQGFGPGGPMQGQGPMQGPPMQGRPVMECGSNGVFILQGSNLIKLDPKTLEKKGEIIILGEKDEDRENAPGPPMGMQSPGEILLSGSNLLVVAGDKFANIDAASFKLKCKTELPSFFGKDNPGGQGMMRQDGQGPQGREGMGNQPPPMDNQMGMQRPPMPMTPAPMLKLNGNMLYILRGEQIIAVNIDSGKVLADNMLRPRQRDFNMNNNPPKNRK